VLFIVKRGRRQDWRSYLATYHDDRPVITERLLSRSMSSPYQW